MSPAVVYGLWRCPPTCSVLWTAKLIGFELSLKNVELLNEEHRAENYLKLNPAHSIPAFVDDDGFTLWDSHAIVTYLVDKYAKDDSLYPKDLKQRALVDNMLHFNNSCLWVGIREHFVVSGIYGKPYDADKEAMARDRLSTLDRVLGQRPYAAGEQLTVADLCLANSVGAIASAESAETDNYPNVVKWQRKLEKEVKYYDEIVAKGAQVLRDFVRASKERKVGKNEKLPPNFCCLSK